MTEYLMGFFVGKSTAELIWIAVGFGGQAMFTMRFLLQWIVSERAKRSIVPELFWYFSLMGGLVLFAYALHKQDPVIAVGQATGIVIYLRNIWLIWREKRLNRAAAAEAAAIPAELPRAPAP